VCSRLKQERAMANRNNTIPLFALKVCSDRGTLKLVSSKQ
jgi:hypothetical protein